MISFPEFKMSGVLLLFATFVVTAQSDEDPCSSSDKYAMLFKENHQVRNQGNLLAMIKNPRSIDECKKSCDEKKGCQSFNHCYRYDSCALYDKKHTKEYEKYTYRKFTRSCTTYYRHTCVKTNDGMCGCGYHKRPPGTFCIPKGLDYLRTGDECKMAAEMLDIPYGGHFAGDDNPSCVYRKNEKKIYFNRNGRARCLENRCRSKMDSNHAAICKEKGPEYEDATPTTKKCNGDWKDCGRSCEDCDIEKDEYCDGQRGVCMKVKNCEFIDSWFDSTLVGSGKAAWQTAVKSGFDYNEKDVAIDKCHNTPGCRGVFLKMPEGVWVLSDATRPRPRYKGEGTIAIPMKCMKDPCSYPYKYAKLCGDYCTAANEGNQLKMVKHSSVDDCKKHCDRERGCQSFTYCGNNNRACYLYDKKLSKNNVGIRFPRTDRCTSYRTCETI